MPWRPRWRRVRLPHGVLAVAAATLVQQAGAVPRQQHDGTHLHALQTFALDESEFRLPWIIPPYFETPAAVLSNYSTIEVDNSTSAGDMGINIYNLDSGWGHGLLAFAAIVLAFEVLFGEKCLAYLRPMSCVTGSTTGGTPADEPSEHPAASETKLAAGKKVDEEQPQKSSEAGESDDTNDEERTRGEKIQLMLIGFLGSFASELYYGIVVPFLPAEAEARRCSGATGIIIACHGFGMLASAQFSPLLMRCMDPLALMRATLATQALCSTAAGLTGGLTGTGFGVAFGVLRFCLGGLAIIVDCCAQTIGFRISPKDLAPAVMAILAVIRQTGTLSSPTVGGLLYPITPGGWPLVFYAGALVFLGLYVSMYAVNSRARGIEPRASAASIRTVLAVPQMRAALAANCVFPFLAYCMMEPLYNQVLTGAPYYMTVSQTGLVASLPGLTQVLGVFFIGTWLYKYTGASVQQGIGLVLSFTSCLLIGPSPLLGNMDPKTGILIAALTLLGLAIGISIMVQPIFALRIMWREKGLTKNDLGGALMGASTSMLVIPMVLGPIFGNTLYPRLGLGWLFTSWGFIMLVTYLPLALKLLPYDTRQGTDPV